MSSLPASAAFDPAPRPDLTEDDRLLNALRDNEEAAFEMLVRTHGGKLLAVARRLLRNEEDAEDALQEGFAAAFRALPAFRGGCRLSTWLHRIVVNAALMKLRSKRQRCETSIDELLPTFLADGHHAIPVRNWSAAEHAVSVKETQVRVRQAIDRLPDSHRTVLMLRDIEELDTNSVAEMLELTANAVKIRLHRARQALSTLLCDALA